MSPAGNVIFLPRGAVVIDIVPENNEDKSPWVVYMCADFKPLFISPIVIPPQKTVLQMAKVRRSKEWAMLTPYWRQRILREGVCPEVFHLAITHMLRHTLLIFTSGHATVCQCYCLLICMGHDAACWSFYNIQAHQYRNATPDLDGTAALFAGYRRGLADGRIRCLQLSVVSEVWQSGAGFWASG